MNFLPLWRLIGLTSSPEQGRLNLPDDDRHWGLSQLKPFIHLYQGDSRDVFPRLLEAHRGRTIFILTDVPYNKGFNYRGKGRQAGAGVWKDDLPHAEYVQMLSMFRGLPSALIAYPETAINYFGQALGKPSQCLCWFYNCNLFKNYRLVCIYNRGVYLDYVQQPPKNPEDKRLKGKDSVRSYDWFNINPVKPGHGEYLGHPCQNPIELMKRILILSGYAGDLIIDPFSGVQSTGIAAHQLGYDYIGIEYDRHWLNVGTDRIRKELNIEPEIERGM